LALCDIDDIFLEVFDNESGKTKVRGGMWGPMKESMETIKKAWKDAS